jgi:RNA polymerase sigma-70 factor (ECF subfamily)
VWDGLSQREAAAALGCSRGAVALRLHRARARLRAAWAEVASQEESVTRLPTNSSNPTKPPFVEEVT